jgi:hypothetical protein
MSMLVLLLSSEAVGGAVSIVLFLDPKSAITSAPVLLQSGEDGTSIIYTNNTSAGVTMESLSWLDGWTKRVKITINNSDIDEILVDFPILVYLSNGSSGEDNNDLSHDFDELQSNANRKKIAITTADGVTQCYVEIERWNDANEQAWLWVKVPSIRNSADTVLYLYYDKAQADNIVYVGDTGSPAAQNVWDSYFKGVWHLGEISGGVGAIKDSTSNNNNGTDNGSPTFNATGQIDSAISFDGIDDYINMTNSASLQFTSSLTIEAWVSLGSFGSGTDVDIILRKGEGNPNDWQLAIHDQRLGLRIEEDDGAGLDGSTILTTTTWFYLTGTWDGSVRRVYLNGSEDGSGSKTGSITPDARDIYIGGRSGTDLSAGVVDEVRASNATRSAAWVKASYESGRDDLLSFGSEERNIVDYVDNSVSNVGSPADMGTHSNFSAQQYGPDSVHDSLTEADTGMGSIVFESSGESYAATGQSSHNFDYSLQRGSGNERLVVATVSWEDAQASAYISSMSFDGTPMTHIVNVTVGTGYSEYISLWYLLDSNLPSSSGNYDVAVTVSESITREIYMAVAEYSGVKQSPPDDYDIDANTSAGDTAITLTAAANGSVVVAGVGEGGTNVLTNTNDISNLQQQILTSSGSALGHHADADAGNITVGWNNLGTREGMAGAVWQPSNTNYELDLEVQWTNVDYTQTHEELCIRTGAAETEEIKVDVWNGSAWINVFASLAANSWNNISVRAYMTSSSFTIRFKGSNEINDRTQDSWSIDAALVHVWTTGVMTLDCLLRVNNTVIDSWQIRLMQFSGSNIGRLQTCSIYFRNSSDETSNQIVIENGSYTQIAGPWYDLEGLETTYIAMTVQANSTGTTDIHTFLEIRVPSTTTYCQYMIAFTLT